jgi:hypothetical protein
MLDTPSFGAWVLMRNSISNDADVLDFGDCGSGTAAVRHIHGFMIFHSISSPM